MGESCKVSGSLSPRFYPPGLFSVEEVSDSSGGDSAKKGKFERVR